MKSLLPCLAIALMAASFAHAEAPRSAHLLRDAFTPVTLLQDGVTVRWTGETDDQNAEASISLGQDGRLEKVQVMQDGQMLTLPDSAFAEMEGAAQAWLEERGSDTTLVIEGEDDAGEWRLALIFGDKVNHLRKRRLSREGQKRDMFTFYNREEEMRASEPVQRASHGRGYYSL